jgi:Nif-specific ferredoxin III
MSETFNVKLPSGETWTPTFVPRSTRRSASAAAAASRCPRGVLELVGVDEDGERVALDSDSDDDDEYEKKVMTIAHRQLCIGCTACAKICPKKCYTHAAAQV